MVSTSCSGAMLQKVCQRDSSIDPCGGVLVSGGSSLTVAAAVFMLLRNP